MDDNQHDHQGNGIPKMPIPHKHTAGHTDSPNDDPNLAAELIRQKIKGLYDDAPGASQELSELEHDHHRRSKHQQFILDLQNSGKSIVEIQTEWHKYYMSLSEPEKIQVWQEFYAANKNAAVALPSPRPVVHQVIDETEQQPTPKLIKHGRTSKKLAEKRTAAEVKQELLNKVGKSSHSAWFQRLHSLIFGLVVGFIVILIFLFSFFNDRFIAPFITPSRNVSAQSLIIDPNSGAVSQDPIIIIPKINVEIPVIYTVPTIDENQIENNLEDGVVHYPITAYPGQDGNGAIFGHSSNNILNPGKYKFAFVLLHDLQAGDTFTLDYHGTAYVYQVFEKEIVSPDDVSVLDDIPGHVATFSLITCDPPGTSIHRLVVVGDQISPNPSNNVAGFDQNATAKPSVLPSNSPSLWSRIKNWIDHF